MQAQAQAVISLCREIAACTDVPGETTRTFLSPATHDVHRILTERMRRVGMEVYVDSAGNLHGCLAGSNPLRPPLLIGSHIDTVPNAGAFDGILGVVLGIALVEMLNGQRREFPIEIIAFSEEEGVRFGIPFIGSRALIGELDQMMLQQPDASRTTIAQAIRDFGIAPAPIQYESGSAYLEFHIEQGPILESLNIPLGVVESIAGQTRMTFHFSGCANHAGTTPMHLRRDALAAAAEWICAIERDTRKTSGLVATVGKITVSPGATNVVPGEAVCSLDLRHPDDAVRISAQQRTIEAARALVLDRSITVQTEIHLDQNAVAMHPRMIQSLKLAARAESISTHRMVSGAGHDAMILAPHIPSAMLFVRSTGGISHHPDESVLVEDVAAALRVGRRFLEQFQPVV